MAALCQRVSWHRVSSQLTPLQRKSNWATANTSTNSGQLCVRASRELESPFSEKASVKKVRGGGQSSVVELWNAREAEGVSSDGFRSFSTTTSALREEPQSDASGKRRF